MFINIASGDQPVDLVADMVIDGILADAHCLAFMVDDVVAPEQGVPMGMIGAIFEKAPDHAFDPRDGIIRRAFQPL